MVEISLQTTVSQMSMRLKRVLITTRIEKNGEFLNKVDVFGVEFNGFLKESLLKKE
jgi:hypothetical protein